MLTEYRPSISELLRTQGADIEDVSSGWNAVNCPFHDDSHKSASFNEDEGVFKCFACGTKGDALTVVMQAHDVPAKRAQEMISELNVPQKPVHHSQPARSKGVSRRAREMMNEATDRYASRIDMLADYLKSRGITRTAAREARLGYVETPLPGHEPYQGRLAIPYLTETGTVDMKFRCVEAHDCKEHGHGKYLCLPGSDSRMYHVTSALTADSFIAVTEGELDAVILNHLCEIPAVGIPGASSWKRHYARVLEDFDRVYVLGDGDKAGTEFARSVSKQVDAGIPIILPAGMDVNDVYLSGGPAAVMNLLGVGL